MSVGGNLAGSLFTLSLFYGPDTNLGGWSWSASLVVLGTYTLLDGFTTTFLQPNLSRIVNHVQNGTLDYILIKPIDSQIWVSLRVFSPWGLPSIISGIILIAIGLYSNGVTLNYNVITVSTITLLSSLCILYSLWFCIATTSIWFVRVWNANEVLRSTLVAGRFPITAYPESLRRIFTFIIPIAFLTTVPAEAMLNLISVDVIMISTFFSISFLLLTKWFWKYALGFYTSASS
nr:ABC-2 family transporter protein [Prochlorococcus sp. MIT 1307]